MMISPSVRKYAKLAAGNSHVCSKPESCVDSDCLDDDKPICEENICKALRKGDIPLHHYTWLQLMRLLLNVRLTISEMSQTCERFYHGGGEGG